MKYKQIFNVFLVVFSLIFIVACTSQNPVRINEESSGETDKVLELMIQNLNSTFERNKDIDPCLNQRMINVSVFGINTSGHIIFDNLNASFISVAPFNLTNKTEQSLGKVFHCGSDIAIYYVPPINITTREMMANKTRFKNPFNISGNEIREYVRSFPKDKINYTGIIFDADRLVGG